MKKFVRALSLFDAVNIALGAIIGAGIFVIIGAASGLAGPAVFISVLIAAAVAAMTGMASASLSKKLPKGGGAYTFAKEALSDFAGFITGWIWLFSNIFAGAAVAVGFGYYLAFFIPSVPPNVGAALAAIGAIAISLLGIKNSSRLNNALVAIKVLILLIFVAVAAFFFKPENFKPLAPFGISGILAGAAAIFFAYAGFARVAVIADEIKNPEKNVPMATIISILVSTLLYLAVAIAAVGIIGYVKLSSSGAPLADAMGGASLPFGSSLMALGALIATGTVMISVITGLSRLGCIMAENRELPGVLGEIGLNGVPQNAILASGIAILALALFADLPSIAYISSFSLLFYYAAINLSGIKMLKSWARYAALAGFASCIILMASLPSLSWVAGAWTIFFGAAYYTLVIGLERKRGLAAA